MSTINSETFRTGTFNFYISPDKIHFILYKNLVSRYSEPLSKMMTSGMKESREGTAFLEHVDVDTFCRFAEFIHSGHYSVAAPAEAPSMATPAPVLPLPEEQSELPGKMFQKKKKNMELPPLLPPAIFAEQATESRVIPFPVALDTSVFKSQALRYAPIFECHVSVYHFAQEYFVLGLKEVARVNLVNMLDRFHCIPEHTGDICHLIRLVYNHEDGSSDPMSLHSIVLKYATKNFKVLSDSRCFRDLLTEGGSFPSDLCIRVAGFWL